MCAVHDILLEAQPLLQKLVKDEPLADQERQFLALAFSHLVRELLNERHAHQRTRRHLRLSREGSARAANALVDVRNELQFLKNRLSSFNPFGIYTTAINHINNALTLVSKP
jgi:hypothetical protein